MALFFSTNLFSTAFFYSRAVELGTLGTVRETGEAAFYL